MHTSEQGIALIKRFEGFSATPYICPAGKNTIGYGHVIGAGEDFSGPVSEEDAEKLLQDDVKVPEQAVNRLVTAQLNQNQFDALVSLIYNIGAAAFQNSTLLRLINTENPAASEQFDRWVYAGGQKLDGLIARRGGGKSVVFSVASHLSSLRRQGSLLPLAQMDREIPAFAGMTNKTNIVIIQYIRY